MPQSDNDIGALSVASTLTVDDTPGIAVKASAGLLYGWSVINTTAAVAYVQVFKKAAVGDVTLGTTVADFVIPLAANGVVNVTLKKPINMTTGIVAFATTTPTGSTGAAVHAAWYFA